MAGMNWDLLDEASEQLEKDKEIIYSGGGGYTVLDDWQFANRKGKNNEAEARLLPQIANMNGQYFVRVFRYKFGKVRLYGRDVLGEHCVANELFEHYQALAETDAEIAALFKDYKQFKRELIYMVPALVFQNEGDYTPMDNAGKIIAFQHKTFTGLHGILADARYRRSDPEWGVFSRKFGRNIVLKDGCKTILPDVSDLDFSSEFYDPYYPGGEKYIDILRYLKTQAKGDEHITSVFNSYFDGTALIDDDGKTRERLLAATDAPKAAAPKAAAPKAAAPKAAAPKAAAPKAAAPKAAAPVETGSDDDELLNLMGGEVNSID